ncbi:Trafficking protein particle complex subunit 12 [Pleurostoma richardsiae]|uniref:Trafficking protein particle complex subunit 12 n=1 Tax=Pleurostoma richardsiae TaxID=41990 RepID=A0AA38R9U5_9PEZI|nr:Trafficking protein particle complex subunit 12 [Pleurostoma richardsiae]
MSQAPTVAARGHARNKSATKASRPRSSTKGPLDADDSTFSVPPQSPLRSGRLIPASVVPQQQSPSTSNQYPRQSAVSPARRVTPPKDFSYLLRPEIYHPIPPMSIPAPFRNSSKQPSPGTPIPDLLARGHFRAAAVAAAHALTGTDGYSPPNPTDHVRIFDLLYTRLACLTLINATPLAALEVKALEDLNSAFYVDEIDGVHLVPWELRVLNVRLQAMGFADPRRAVMSYYDLARDTRIQIANATASHDNSARELWKDRLYDLGIKIAGALIEMDDFVGASYHLSTLRARDDEKTALSQALLLLHIGDVHAARQCFRGDEASKMVIAALCDMADGDYGAALPRWRELQQETPDEMIAVNMAVCLLYTGKMEEGRDLLATLIDSGYSSHTLLFNLTTTYELCTDRPRSFKLVLAGKVAGLVETPKGWEKGNGDFKL